ncbi:MAG TPA: hypothetical protein VFW75_10470 [Acetobacteraceae bacterium]|nr:hypothetical protein [Acetobacteraceae bacterium]
MGIWRGGLVNAYRLVDLLSPHGDAGTLWRADLLRLLLSRPDPHDIRLDTTVSGLEQTGQDVRVKFSDASEGRCHLVVDADGIHSSVRRLLFGETPLTATGWGGWVWWAPAGIIPMNDVTEYWGAGRFVGLYPTRGNIGVFAGGPLEAVEVPPGSTLRHHLAQRFAARREPLGLVLDSVPDSDEVVLWRLEDVRSPIGTAAAWS